MTVAYRWYLTFISLLGVAQRLALYSLYITIAGGVDGGCSVIVFSLTLGQIYRGHELPVPSQTFYFLISYGKEPNK